MKPFYRLTITNHKDAFIRETFDKTECLNIQIKYQSLGYSVKIEKLNNNHDEQKIRS